MRKLLENMKKKQEGFTLIELIIVIAILAIIAAIAVPNILGAVDNSRKATDVANAKIIANAAAQVKAKFADYSTVEGTFTINNGVNAPSSPTTQQTNFANQLEDELSGANFSPSFDGKDEFDLVITGTTVTVSIDGEELIPETSTVYQQD